MKKAKIPEIIYLQWYDGSDDEEGPDEDLEGITWCIDKIHENDLEYRLIKVNKSKVL